MANLPNDVCSRDQAGMNTGQDHHTVREQLVESP
jgi:hypothetical protein